MSRPSYLRREDRIGLVVGLNFTLSALRQARDQLKADGLRGLQLETGKLVRRVMAERTKHTVHLRRHPP